jgi:hypothetical protein
VSPEGADEDPAILLVRLAAEVADVVPLEIRKQLTRRTDNAC